jgi:hypothetical protein
MKVLILTLLHLLYPRVIVIHSPRCFVNQVWPSSKYTTSSSTFQLAPGANFRYNAKRTEVSTDVYLHDLPLELATWLHVHLLQAPYE